MEPSAEAIPGAGDHIVHCQVSLGVALVIVAAGISALIAPFISPTNTGGHLPALGRPGRTCLPGAWASH